MFDLYCGNGVIAGLLDGLGFYVTGMDTSETGIAQARAAHPRCWFDVGSADDDLAKSYGRFPLVVSLEVVEHLFDPSRYAHTLFDLVERRGAAIVATPHHGYASGERQARQPLHGALGRRAYQVLVGRNARPTSTRGRLPVNEVCPCRPHSAAREVDDGNYPAARVMQP